MKQRELGGDDGLHLWDCPGAQKNCGISKMDIAGCWSVSTRFETFAVETSNDSESSTSPSVSLHTKVLSIETDLFPKGSGTESLHPSMSDVGGFLGERAWWACLCLEERWGFSHHTVLSFLQSRLFKSSQALLNVWLPSSHTYSFYLFYFALLCHIVTQTGDTEQKS